MTGKIIGVFGGGMIATDGEEWRMAEEVGRRIAEAGHYLLTGGLGGVMTAASKGAKNAGGITIAVMPGNRKSGAVPNPYVDIPIFTGMGEARNVINVKSCDAAIAIGGEYGTLSEIALALKAGCPMVLLHSWNFSPWSGDRPSASLATADSAAEAVNKALSLC
ncbi:MAG: TIGR00725 family protein [Thermodesulfobacteriota bacterium]